MELTLNYKVKDELIQLFDVSPYLPCAEWAEQNVVLSTDASPTMPGPLVLQPWWYKILNKLDCLDTIYRVIQSSTQQGKTTMMAIAILYGLFHRHLPCFICFPDQIAAVRFFRHTLIPIIQSSPKLKEMVIWNKANVNKFEIHTKAGVMGRIAWAGSQSSMASTAAGVCILDEVGKYDHSLGVDASPIDLAKARMFAFLRHNPYMIVASTPTDKHSPLQKQLDESTLYEWKFTCPNPECQKLVGASAGNLRYDLTATLQDIELKRVPIFYECPECRNQIDEPTFRQVVETGDWCLGEDPGEIEDKEKEGEQEAPAKTVIEKEPVQRSIISKGYFLPGVLSKTMGWWYIVSRKMQIRGSFIKLRNWKQNICGERHSEEREYVSQKQLDALENNQLKEWDIPNDTISLLAGVDVGKKNKDGDYNFWVVVGAMRPNNCVTIVSVQHYIGIAALTAYLGAPRQTLDGKRTFPHVERTFIDTGYNARIYIYQICAQIQEFQALKGSSKTKTVRGKLPVRMSRVEAEKYNWGTAKYLDTPLMLGYTNTVHFKEQWTAMLAAKQVEFVGGLNKVFYTHLKNEQRELNVDTGQVEYRPTYKDADQHAYDSVVYMLAGAYLMNVWDYDNWEDYQALSASTPVKYEPPPQMAAKPPSLTESVL